MSSCCKPSLLDSARNLVKKSSRVAGLTIMPLAAVSVTQEAAAQTIFEVAVSTSGSGSFGNATFIYDGGESALGATLNGSLDEVGQKSNLFNTPLADFNGVQGLIVGSSTTYTFTNPGDGSVYLDFGRGPLSGTVLGAGIDIPISYSYTLGSAGSIVISGTSIYVNAFGDHFSSPSTLGTGSFSGSGSITGTGSQNVWESGVFINYEGAQIGDTLSFAMSEGTEGVMLNVPEPSTYAIISGVLVFGFVAMRRRRQVCA